MTSDLAAWLEDVAGQIRRTVKRVPAPHEVAPMTDPQDVLRNLAQWADAEAKLAKMWIYQANHIENVVANVSALLIAQAAHLQQVTNERDEAFDALSSVLNDEPTANGEYVQANSIDELLDALDALYQYASDDGCPNAERHRFTRPNRARLVVETWLSALLIAQAAHLKELEQERKDAKLRAYRKARVFEPSMDGYSGAMAVYEAAFPDEPLTDVERIHILNLEATELERAHTQLLAQAAHLKELEQENDDLKLRMGLKTDWSGHWLVARKRDTEPWEVWAFDRYDHAALHFDACQQQWSTVYFARVAHCEGHPLDVTPLIHEMSARLTSQAAHLERVHQEHDALKKENQELLARVDTTDGPRVLLPQPPTGDRWRPIETAPKDGREVLAHDDGAVMLAWWSDDHGAWMDNGPMNPPPQHWLPLPAPPES